MNRSWIYSKIFIIKSVFCNRSRIWIFRFDKNFRFEKFFYQSQNLNRSVNQRITPNYWRIKKFFSPKITIWAWKDQIVFLVVWGNIDIGPCGMVHARNGHIYKFTFHENTSENQIFKSDSDRTQVRLKSDSDWIIYLKKNCKYLDRQNFLWRGFRAVANEAEMSSCLKNFFIINSDNVFYENFDNFSQCLGWLIVECFEDRKTFVRKYIFGSMVYFCLR